MSHARHKMKQDMKALVACSVYSFECFAITNFVTTCVEKGYEPDFRINVAEGTDDKFVGSLVIGGAEFHFEEPRPNKRAAWFELVRLAGGFSKELPDQRKQAQKAPDNSASAEDKKTQKSSENGGQKQLVSLRLWAESLDRS